MRAYFQAGAPEVVRGSFYEWFGPKLEQVMNELVARAMAYAAAHPVDLPSFLAIAKDWRIVDSTTIKLDKRLKDVYRGAGDYAAVKIHKTMSVGCGTTVAYHLSPAREHDSKHLTIDESWRGYGLLIDLGYASLARLRDCERFGAYVVLRLKENWQPKVESIRRGEVTGTFAAGTDLDVLLAEDVLLLDGKVIDAAVTVGSGSQAIRLRLVGVPAPATGRYCFFLTNLPATVGPRQVADLYRVRWEIEINNKLDKSSHRLDEIDARKPSAVNAMIAATIISSIVVCLLAHKHHLAQKAVQKGALRTSPPLHAGLLARMIASAAHRLASALDLRGAKATAEWETLAGILVHMGEDPNWRHKGTVLDHLRGWKAPPKRRKPARNPQ